jgi:hypothetical protein
MYRTIPLLKSRSKESLSRQFYSSGFNTFGRFSRENPALAENDGGRDVGRRPNTSIEFQSVQNRRGGGRGGSRGQRGRQRVRLLA